MTYLSTAEYEPATAVDGRLSTQSRRIERNSWWSVDLYRSYEVVEVHFITTTLTGKHICDLC